VLAPQVIDGPPITEVIAAFKPLPPWPAGHNRLPCGGW